jgi:hypothetical protein
MGIFTSKYDIINKVLPPPMSQFKFTDTQTNNLVICTRWTNDTYTVKVGGLSTDVDSQLMEKILNYQYVPNEIISQFTVDEEEELKELKVERDKYLTQQRLIAFQQLPAHIRQEIVDEAYLKETIREISSVDDSKFPNIKRYHQLKKKMDSSKVTFDVTSNVYLGYQYKYADLLNLFTLEQLTEAHTSATLEEQL